MFKIALEINLNLQELIIDIFPYRNDNLDRLIKEIELPENERNLEFVRNNSENVYLKTRTVFSIKMLKINFKN